MNSFKKTSKTTMQSKSYDKGAKKLAPHVKRIVMTKRIQGARER